MRRLRPHRAWSLLFMLTAFPAAATTSLSVDAAGYVIEMEVGDDVAPVIAGVRFHAPGDAAGVRLAPSRWRVAAFDAGARELRVEYDGGDGGVPGFKLAVQGDVAELVIDDERIVVGFDWQR